MLYYKSAQPVPGKGEAWTLYECDEKFNIKRYLTFIPTTGETTCVARPLVKKMSNMHGMEQISQESFERYWVDPEPDEYDAEEAAVEGNEDGAPVFRPDMTVAEAMSLHPRVAEVFAAFRLGGCGSCGIGKMETVEQVCMAYGVDVDMLMEVLDDLVRPEEEAKEPTEA